MKLILALSLALTLFTTALRAEPVLQLTQEQALAAAVIEAQDRGGGNPYEAEFRSIGKLVLQQMKDKNLSIDQLGFSLFAFEVAVNETPVIGTDRTDLTDLFGKDRPAVNSPSAGGIVFNNSLWAILDMPQKRQWVTHEFLRFTNVDDSRNTFSTHALELIGETPLAPNRKGRTFRITAVKSRYDLLLPGGAQTVYDLALEGMSRNATIACSPNYNNPTWARLFFNEASGSITLNKDLGSRCENLVAYLLLVNSGTEAYLTITPAGFEIY